MTRVATGVGAGGFASVYEASPYARHGLLFRLFLLGAASVWWALGAPLRRGWVVLCYHGVRDGEAAGFARQVAMMRSRVGSLSEVDGPTPRGVRVAITFDDAFENLIRNALPVLREGRVPATVFVVTGNLGETPRWSMPAGHPERNERVMTEAQVAALAREGFPDLGTHTHTHRSLDTLEDGEIRGELERSVGALKSMGVASVETLAAPHGAWDARVAEAARMMGLRLLTLEPVLVREGSARVGRFSSSPGIWPMEFWLLIRGGYGFLAPLRGIKRRLKRSGGNVRGHNGASA